jgi:hypothetical protein
LITFRPFLSPEERKEKDRENSRRNYERAKATRRELEAKIKGFVLTGRMSQDEADSVMLSSLHGHYRMQYKKQMLERQAQREAEARRTADSALQHQQESTAALVSRSDLMLKNLDTFRNFAITQTEHLAQIFFPSDQLVPDAPRSLLTRGGFIWPSEPSPLAFYLIYAACVPVGLWPADGNPAPDVGTASSSALLCLHEDKLRQYGIAGAFTGCNPHKVAAVFLELKTMVTDFLSNADDSMEEKQSYLNQNWESAKHYVLRGLRTESTTFPPFIIAYMVDQAAEKATKAAMKAAAQAAAQAARTDQAA